MKTVRSVPLHFHLLFMLGFLVFPVRFWAQIQTTTSDPVALSAAQRFVTVSVGRSSVSSFQATGNAEVWQGTTPQTGSVQLASAGPRYTYVQFQTSQGTYTDQRGVDASGIEGGRWSNGQQTKSTAYRNVYLGGSWFFPLLSTLSRVTDASLQFTYVGQETWHQTQVLHIRVTKILAIGKNAPKGQNALATEYYLDPTTFLLKGMSAGLSPDDGSSATVAWEVLYGSYVQEQGVLLPMHIEQYLNGTLIRQIDLSSVQLNSAVPQSLFDLGQ